MTLPGESNLMYHFHVADDHPLFRNAIIEVIKRHYPDAVVAESMDLDSTIKDLENNCYCWT
jgi:DNA-binding NarL/FixJ family response regulator